MKTRKPILFIAFTGICLVLFSFKNNKEENLIRYFINPNLGKTNFRTFESKNESVKNVLFKQIIEENKNDDGVRMEYYFLTPDSIPFQGGIEIINPNKVRILQQYLYLDNRKIIAHKITGNVWNPFTEKGKIITNEFLDKKTGFGFKSTSKAYGRIKDTLNKNSFIVEFTSKTLYLIDGKKIDEIYSKVKRLYVKDKGLIYYRETVNGNNTDYYLNEKN